MEIHDFRYEPLSASEQSIAARLMMALTTDEDILGQIDDFHSSGSRCAAVVILESGEFTGGYVGGEEAIAERFPFPQVLGAMATYDPGETLCMIFQRDDLVSVGIVGSNNLPEIGLN